MISDRGVSHTRLVRGTLIGTSTIIQCYPLVRAFLYPPPEDAHGCQRVPARCPRFESIGITNYIIYKKYICNVTCVSCRLLAIDCDSSCIYILHTMSYMYRPILVFFSSLFYFLFLYVCKCCFYRSFCKIIKFILGLM